jgi:hypothetical protein
MKTMALRRVILVVLVAATVAVSPAAWAQDDTFEFTMDAAKLAADRHTVVVSGTYTCGPMDLDVVGGGGTVDLTVGQRRVTGFGFAPIEVCDGTAQPYQAEVITFGQHRFNLGRASASASGIVHGEQAGVPLDQRTELINQPITITH